MIDWPPEIEYHARAAAFGVFGTLAIAYWGVGPRDTPLTDAVAVYVLLHLAGLSLLWWRVPNGRWRELIEAVRSWRRGADDERRTG